MSNVTKATSMFTKLCWVSTLDTPREPHLALVSTGSGGMRPKIQPEANGFSITVEDGASPVSMVAWKHAAVETSSAAQAMAAIGRIGPSVGWGVAANMQPSGRVRSPSKRRECVGELNPDHGAEDQDHRAERARGDRFAQEEPAQEDGDHGIHVGVGPDDGRGSVLERVRVGTVSHE